MSPIPEPHHSAAGQARAAFTLVELLLAVGILVLLIALTLSVAARAREWARSGACLSNLRQMAVAAQSYVAENDGDYPPAYWYADDNAGTVAYCWDLTTINGRGAAGGPARVVPGLLWQTTDATRVQQCPAFEGAADWLADPYTGYNYNTSFIGHGQFETTAAPAKAVSLRHPSTTALFGDGQWAGGANKFMRAPFPNPGDASFSGRWAGTQGFRHLGRTNVGFCDGHAESLSDRFAENADGSDNVAPGTGFLSKDNATYDTR